jgi:hypothetical protein
MDHLYNNDYTKTSYYVEHDDFFMYIREYLQDQKNTLYTNIYEVESNANSFTYIFTDDENTDDENTESIIVHTL